MTFSPHPQEVLKKGLPFFHLTSDQEKLDLLANFVDVVLVQKDDREFLALSAKDFIDDILVKELQVKNVIVGDDFTFGKMAHGNALFLKKLGDQHGFATHIIEPVLINNERCSSSRIRAYLRAGDLLAANAMLTRPFFLGGMVREGQKQGRLLGFRTANIHPPPGFSLRHGVYATVTRVVLGNVTKDYLSATNVGTRPTVTDQLDVVVESHCLDQEIDLYDRYIKIFFIERLRDEVKFSSMAALREHIEKDCLKVRELQEREPARFNIKDC
jgi:riboflavin kinase/FMN adenylyltransferase